LDYLGPLCSLHPAFPLDCPWIVGWCCARLLPVTLIGWLITFTPWICLWLVLPYICHTLGLPLPLRSPCCPLFDPFTLPFVALPGYPLLVTLNPFWWIARLVITFPHTYHTHTHTHTYHTFVTQLPWVPCLGLHTTWVYTHTYHTPFTTPLPITHWITFPYLWICWLPLVCVVVRYTGCTVLVTYTHTHYLWVTYSLVPVAFGFGLCGLVPFPHGWLFQVGLPFTPSHTFGFPVVPFPYVGWIAFGYVFHTVPVVGFVGSLQLDLPDCLGLDYVGWLDYPI